MEVTIPLPPEVGHVACTGSASAGRELVTRIHRTLTAAGYRCDAPCAVVGGWEILVEHEERPICLTVACNCAPGSAAGHLEVHATYEGLFGEGLDARRRRDVSALMAAIERLVRETVAAPRAPAEPSAD